MTTITPLRAKQLFSIIVAMQTCIPPTPSAQAGIILSYLNKAFNTISDASELTKAQNLPENFLESFNACYEAAAQKLDDDALSHNVASCLRILAPDNQVSPKTSAYKGGSFVDLFRNWVAQAEEIEIEPTTEKKPNPHVDTGLTFTFADGKQHSLSG